MTRELSSLGLGTAAFSRRLGRTEALAALHAAWDEGITHIDTAPMYGLGHAETLVGGFIAGRRDQITVTTKIGILPPAAAALRVIPGRLLRGPLGSRQDFSLGVVRSSFERSLKALCTDHVDCLLLHECSPAHVTDELVAFLEACVTGGTALAVGTATSLQATASIADRWRPFPAVEQLPWDPRRRARAGPTTITHSSLRLALSTARDRPDAIGRWSTDLGVDCAQSDVIAGLALALARRDNSNGSTLFGARSPERIRANCRLAGGFARDVGLLDRFRELLTSPGSDEAL